MMFEIPSYNPVPAIGNQDLLSIKGDIEAVTILWVCWKQHHQVTHSYKQF